MAQYMLTTVDNPFHPFTQFDDWDSWDRDHGYHTSSYLARVVRTSDDLSEAQQEQAVQDAIDEIVEYNVLGIYRRIKKDDRVIAA